MTYLPTLANGVGGFFIVEQTLLQQVRARGTVVANEYA